MNVAVLVLFGALIGGVRSAPTPGAALPELSLQPPVHNAAPTPFIKRHHAQDELGQVNYGFSHPGQTKNEVRDAAGNVAGAYSYIDADNKIIVVEYTAGEGGFQVKSNNLPIAAQDTPEVLAAKLQFVQQYNAAALAAANADNNEPIENLHQGSQHAFNVGIPIQVVSAPVKETPEVIAAKLKFVQEYNAAALAAANAPDDPQDILVDTPDKTITPANYNPVKDTPEVVAAKIKFVETYNAAALAATQTPKRPTTDGNSQFTITYAIPAVKDTPEVLAAKLRFVEEYNAAAINAALAKDTYSQPKETLEDTSTVTDNPFDQDDPVTELGFIDDQEISTTFPSVEDFHQGSEQNNVAKKQENVKKQEHTLIPTLVTEHSDSSKDIHDSSQLSVLPLVLKSPAIRTFALSPDAAVPVAYVSRHHAQDESGRVNYGFTHPGQAKNELRDASGNVEGFYSYTDSNDKVVRVEYTAGDDGFQVQSNHLPIAPLDTPEVLAAKLQFVEAYNAAALAAAAAPDDEVSADSISNQNDVVFPSPVKDTPEVLAAKLQFVNAYNAAALASANAPDDVVMAESGVPQLDGQRLVNFNPVMDTPEVIEAKLRFVEEYNAASLAAATIADDAEAHDTSEITVVYVSRSVPDTPEVVAAKLKFVEAYNAAALAAASAPDDEVQNSVDAIVEDIELNPNAQYSEGDRIGSSDVSKENENTVIDSSVVFPVEYKDDVSSNLQPVEEYPVILPVQVLQTPVVTFETPDSGAAIPITYASQHHAQDEFGQVNYGFSHPGQVKNEVRDASGNVEGFYTYVDSEDKVVRVEYTAGEDGFQVRSNNLPIAPLDTPEVLAAKLQFVEDYNAAALAAAAAPDDEVSADSISNQNDVVFPSPVKDTPEVLAAKLQFVDAYNAAALAAANAPDDVDMAESGLPQLDGQRLVNFNPVMDTPEVIEAKLRFVEEYNAASLAAATTANDAEAYDTSEITVVYASRSVPDTPEVVAAKLKFVEAYNAAALAAALAPDDEEQNNVDAIVEDIKLNPNTQYNEGNSISSSDASKVNENTVIDSSVVFPVEYQDAASSNLQPVEEYPVISPVQVLQTPVITFETPDSGAAIPITYASQHHAQDEFGQVNYGFSHPGQVKNEVRDASGNVEGFYTYVDSEDKVVRVEYTAGEDGFQVRSNNLPIAPLDTPEVLAAKLQFVEAYNAAALAAAAAPDDEVSADSISNQNDVVFPSPVKDTPEVLATKLQFVDAYNAAALAAANAPDDVDMAESGVPLLDGQKLVNFSPVMDTPEVIEAKLRFVEEYNAAALTAATIADDAEAHDTSEITVVYATRSVPDTPEVVAAKLKFVEAYNAAALAAALAPDDDVQNRGDAIVTNVQLIPNTQYRESNTISLSDAPTVYGNTAIDSSVVFPVEYQEVASSNPHQVQESPIDLPQVLQTPATEFQTSGPVAAVPYTFVSRHHAQDELGQVNYGFSHPGQAKNEVRDASGNVAGFYTYVDSDDKAVRVEYTAGEDGFQVRSNNLPIAPLDTPEVLAAKLQFVEAYNAAALAAAAAPDDDVSTDFISSQNDVVFPSPVKDTPEVLAAKLQFVDAYNAAALAAANAPDDVDMAESGVPQLDGQRLVNFNPVMDTPEVIEAKLRFVEEYNAASLAAANIADDAEAHDTSEITVVYASRSVPDTPEVVAAKLKFVEAYNAAALAAALAPDDEVQDSGDAKGENVQIIPNTEISEGTSNTLSEETTVNVHGHPYFSYYAPSMGYPVYLSESRLPTYLYSVPYGFDRDHAIQTSSDSESYPFYRSFYPPQLQNTESGSEQQVLYAPSYAVQVRE